MQTFENYDIMRMRITCGGTPKHNKEETNTTMADYMVVFVNNNSVNLACNISQTRWGKSL